MRCSGLLAMRRGSGQVTDRDRSHAVAVDDKRLGAPDVATHDVSDLEADEVTFDVDLSSVTI